MLALAGRRVAAPGSAGLNPAFDVTPAALVTAIVTERRTISGRAADRRSRPACDLAAGMAAAEQAGLNAPD